jgi:hypothetical protein
MTRVLFALALPAAIALRVAWAGLPEAMELVAVGIALFAAAALVRRPRRSVRRTDEALLRSRIASPLRVERHHRRAAA